MEFGFKRVQEIADDINTCDSIVAVAHNYIVVYVCQ